MRRQAKVSADVSNFFFANKILTSKQLWDSILTDPATAPEFTQVFADQLVKAAQEQSNGLVDLKTNPENGNGNNEDNPSLRLQRGCHKATTALPQYLTEEFYQYIDQQLDLEQTWA